MNLLKSKFFICGLTLLLSTPALAQPIDLRERYQRANIKSISQCQTPEQILETYVDNELWLNSLRFGIKESNRYKSLQLKFIRDETSGEYVFEGAYEIDRLMPGVIVRPVHPRYKKFIPHFLEGITCTRKDGKIIYSCQCDPLTS